MVAYKYHESLVEQPAELEKAAMSFPGKLQQIALNYDRAHLKASQWNFYSEDRLKDPTAGQKATDEITNVQVVVQDGSSVADHVPLTEGSGHPENFGLDTAQPQAANEDEANKEKPSHDEDSDDVDGSKTPWNAVCVIGLRVLSKDANLGLRLEQLCHTI